MYNQQNEAVPTSQPLQAPNASYGYPLTVQTNPYVPQHCFPPQTSLNLSNIGACNNLTNNQGNFS